MTSFYTAFDKASHVSSSDLEENAQCFPEGRKLEIFGNENGLERATTRKAIYSGSLLGGWREEGVIEKYGSIFLNIWKSNEPA